MSVLSQLYVRRIYNEKKVSTNDRYGGSFAIMRFFFCKLQW